MTCEILPEPMENLVTLGLRFRLVDVREDDEYSQHPIVADYRIPFSRFDPTELRTPRDAPLLVLCDKGLRSLSATIQLREQGWKNAFSLHGGLSALTFDSRNGDIVQAA